MADLTLQSIEELLDGMFDRKLEPIQKTLAQHTAALEALLSDKKKRDELSDVSEHRLKQLEEWAKKASQKLGIEFSP